MLVKKKSAVRPWLKITFLVVLFLAVVGGLVYVFRYSNLFEVKDIEVGVINGGGETMTAADVLNGQQYTNILAPFPAINTADFPYIADFTVSKNYLERTVSIQAIARQQEFVWCMTSTTTSCFWTDDSGFIFETAPQISGGNFKVVDDSTGRDIGIGDYALPAIQFKIFVADMNILSQLNIPVSSIQVANINYDQMTVVTDGGPEIYFGFTFDPVVSGDDAVLKQIMQSPDWTKDCYIDLRTMYKVYTSYTC